MELQVGQTVWIRKSGNALYYLRGIKPENRNFDDMIDEEVVATVGRKWFTLVKNRYSNCRFSIESGAIDGKGYSCDYFVYLTKQEIIDFFDREKILSKINYNNNWQRKLNLDQLKRIIEIIEKKDA